MLDVRAERTPTQLRVVLTGELGLAESDRVRDLAFDVCDGDIVVLDCSGIRAHDEFGFGALIAFLRRVRHSGGDTVLITGDSPLRAQFVRTGVDRLVRRTIRSGCQRTAAARRLPTRLAS